MNKKTANTIRMAGAVLLLIYFICLVYFLFLSEQFGRTQMGDELRYNLVPLREIRRFLGSSEVLGMYSVLENLAGNVLGFVPLGALLPVLYKRVRRGPWMILVGAWASGIVEVTQLLLHVGIFDVDDVILNTLGTAVGFLAFRICDHIRRVVLKL